jgi:hypothetical protein
MAYVLKNILLGSLCIVATVETAMSRHVQVRPFAVDPASNCASRCAISRGQISCVGFLVTPDHYPLNCYTYKMTLTACGWQLERVFGCP